MGTAWARHAMFESAFTVASVAWCVGRNRVLHKLNCYFHCEAPHRNSEHRVLYLLAALWNQWRLDIPVRTEMYFRGKGADFSETRSSSKMVSSPSRAQIELHLKSAPFGAIMRSFWGCWNKSIGISKISDDEVKKVRNYAC